MQYGALIRQRRAAMGMKQEELASLLGVSLRRILNRMGLQPDRPREDD